MKLPLPTNNVPAGATLGAFALERQSLDHNEADYRAVMSARLHLRDWSGDGWPENDFTPEQNREDLAGHIEEAEEAFAYGYTVFAPDRSVAGSVYVYPAAFIAGRYALAERDRQDLLRAQVATDYWLLPGIEATAAAVVFARELRHWLAAGWGFDGAAWPTRPRMQARRRLYDELGYRSLGSVEALNTPGWHSHFHLG